MPAKRRVPKKPAGAGSASGGKRRRDKGRQNNAEEGGEEPPQRSLVFEDPFGDDVDEEDAWVEKLDDEERRRALEEASRDEMDVEEDEEKGAEAGEASGSRALDDIRRMQEIEAMEEVAENAPRQLWVPGMSLGDGEELVMDPSAYVMYHAVRPEWPALSFDILRDGLGDRRSRFPHTMYLAMGSQAPRAQDNKISVLKLSELHRTQQNDDSGAESDEDDHLDDDPILDQRFVRHRGGVNRLRSMPQVPHMVATMADTSNVHVYNVANALRSFDERGIPPQEQKPVYTFSGHRSEGFAVDWSPLQEGQFATGDNMNIIHVHSPKDGASWQPSNPMRGHTGPVEDIQFSPTEPTVFASCSCDGTLRIWDTRSSKGAMITTTAHPGTDVNVISWNRNMTYLLASGADDGGMKIWDLRLLKSDARHIASYTYHRKPITSIEWHPTDESVLAVSSDDDQLSIWDFSVEEDDEALEASKAPTVAESVRRLPPQLLFIHQGQQLIKELHFHPQIPGALLSTSQDALNIFKPATNI